MEGIFMWALVVGAVVAGTFLTIVFGAMAIGIAWDVLANRAARARESGGLATDLRLAAGLTGEPVFQRDSWYGRLVLQAYGADRGWIVFLRRLFFRTGFQYEAGPAFPLHRCPETETCATCAEWDITGAPYYARKCAAYRYCLAMLRRPPYRQPFFMNAPDDNVCPTFWSVVLAAWVYVPFVLAPKFALAATLFVLVGAASTVGAAYHVLTQRYGVSMTRVVCGVAGFAVALAATLGVRATVDAYVVWQRAHADAIEAGISSRMAAPEFAAHAVERALLEEQYATAVTLAALGFLDEQRDRWIATQQRQCDEYAHQLAAVPRRLAPSSWFIHFLWNCGESTHDVAYDWIGIGRGELDRWGRRESVVWWDRARRGRWEYAAAQPLRASLLHAEDVDIVADEEDRRAVLDRVLAEVEYLTAGDGDALRAVFAPYAAMAQRARAVLTARFDAASRTFALPPFDGSDRNARSWVQSRCAYSDGAWVSDRAFRDYAPDHQQPANSVCVRSNAGYTCRVPDAMCAHAAAAVHTAEEARHAARVRAAVVEREADRKRSEEYQRIELPARAALIAHLTALRGEPVALHAILRRSCKRGSYDRWYATAATTVSSDTCTAVAEMFADDITLAERYLWFEGTRTAVVSAAVGWWNGYAAIVGIALVFVLGYIACVYVLTVLALRLGVADMLARAAQIIPYVAVVLWRLPMVVAARAATAAVARWGCWLVWQPFRGIGIAIRAIAVGIRDTALLLAAFAKAWYEKRCYQITWQ